MSFGCSLKQAWGVDGFHKEKERTIRDNNRAHEMPPVSCVPHVDAPPPQVPLPTRGGDEPDVRVLYAIGVGVMTVLLLEVVFKMGRSSS